jgi:hypothetical protein
MLMKCIYEFVNFNKGRCFPGHFQKAARVIQPWGKWERPHSEVMANHRRERSIKSRVSARCRFCNAERNSQTGFGLREAIAQFDDGAKENVLASAVATHLFVEKICPPRNGPRKGGKKDERTPRGLEEPIKGRNSWVMD